MATILKKGIDVSYANGSIDWGKVKNSGVEFAILRSTFGSNLPSQIDSQFFQNAQGCVKNNIPFGTYHFAYFVNEQKAKEEAEFAIAKADEYKQYVKFIVLDVEEDSERYANSMGYKPDWTACSIAFMERIKSAGYTPVLYSNYSWLKDKFDYSRLKKYKLWYAAPDVSKPAYDCAMWQYSWKGKVNGISGDVDMNYLYDAGLFKATNTTATTSTSKPATSTKTTTTVDDKAKFLNTARSYIGKNGNYVCNTKLKLGAVYDWCAFSVSAIMKDCNFIGKYIKAVEGGAGDIPRYSDGKYGTWFAKNQKTPQAGDLIFFRYAGITPTDKYFSSHVGIVEAVSGNTLTTLEGNVDGNNSNWAATSTFKRKTRYLSSADVYAFYRPNWSTEKYATSTSTSSTTTQASSKQTTTNASNQIDVLYQVYAGGKWLPWVKNTEDYAGIENKSIQGVRVKLSQGSVMYRARLTNGKWLPWVYDANDYAGLYGKNIDCVQMMLCDLDNYKIQYRVSTTSSASYLPWVANYNEFDDDGYAGVKGKSIDKLQIKIVKK